MSCFILNIKFFLCDPDIEFIILAGGKALYSPRNDPVPDRNDPQPWNDPQIDPEMIPTFLLVDPEMIRKKLWNGD